MPGSGLSGHSITRDGSPAPRDPDTISEIFSGGDHTGQLDPPRPGQRDIFRRRLNLKPWEYPELARYVDSIRHSYWIHTEFNYTADIQDFRVHVTDLERDVIRKAMLAIAQIEVSVKTFWGDIYQRLPKPEIGSVGYTFAESEVRHHDAYSHLLELLGLNHEFGTIHQIPCIMGRIRYLDTTHRAARSQDPREYTLAILLFSLFIEHVSLFSQFLIILSFNKYRNLFKGISNVIEATSKEEQIHGLFGIDLIRIIRQEQPQWFDQEMSRKIADLCHEAWHAESEIVHWLFQKGELEFLPKALVLEFIKNRFNNSLRSIGEEPLLEVDPAMLRETEWFDDEVITTKHGDFFVKRSINYNKRSRSITGDDLF
ncbi:ribonucleotide-diphosphate reductase subunit beta [Alkalispirochaeta alkalica]|uniref:ribonucleotide-diphosphate reductase subunit beta n=1 Tax=Alkalispirochaeta alkalica TaxID=46356 RepID=UPI00036D26B4|nr:ribonucleotide-diphosphate reductase subunit beta [Alkalispirochaeta alkalica]